MCVHMSLLFGEISITIFGGPLSQNTSLKSEVFKTKSLFFFLYSPKYKIRGIPLLLHDFKHHINQSLSLKLHATKNNQSICETSL